MRQLFTSLILVVCLVGNLYAVPLGGKGSDRKESIKGNLEVVGSLSVDGKTIFNGNVYIWPKNKDKIPKGYILRNNGEGNLIWDKEVVPSGVNGSIQFNNNNVFASDKDLVWDSVQKKLLVNESEVSLKGHKHTTQDVIGIIPIELGGTGTDNGSIFGKDNLILSSAKNKNVVISAPEQGAIIFNANEVLSKSFVNSEKGFKVKNEEGYSGVLTIISDIKVENNIVSKKIRQITFSSGILTKITNDSDWIECGKVIIPKIE